MIEKALIVTISFILGALFVRFWDEWRARKRLEKCMDEIARKRLKISLEDYLERPS